MLKLLSSSAFRQIYPTHLASPLRAATESLSSISGRASRGSGFCQKAFFCSEAGDGSNSDHGLNDHSTVLVIPRWDDPMLPLHIEEYCDVKDPLFSALLERYEKGTPYVCVSLLKDCPGTDSGMATGGLVSENSMHGVKGKELFDRLHKVGTLSKIKYFWGRNIYLAGLRRVRITEMVGEDLITVKVDHLKDLPFDKDDARIKATFSELRLALKNYLADFDLAELLKDVDECDFQQLADYGAGLFIDSDSKLELQAVLEELDVHKRLQLTLEIVGNFEIIRY